MVGLMGVHVAGSGLAAAAGLKISQGYILIAF
jgi:hypothetical protein